MSPELLNGTMHTLDVVLFYIGTWRVGVEARQIRALRPSTSQQPCPRLEELLHLPKSIDAAQTALLLRPQQLQLSRADIDQVIEVDGPIDIIGIPVLDIHPLPRLLAARTQLSGLRALLVNQQGVIPLLDLVQGQAEQALHTQATLGVGI